MKKKVLKHIKEDVKTFKQEIKDDKKLVKAVKGAKTKCDKKK